MNFSFYQSRMAGVASQAIALFLAFTRTYKPEHAFNMIVIILDPRFKDLQILVDFVGRFGARYIDDQYDSRVIIPLLVKVFQFLYPSAITTMSIKVEGEDHHFEVFLNQ